ncbi:MAG TPA: glycosyltransferase family 4 protein [Gemmataceae bacterium]|nr:glycosyltransferase family 4 protein [Gemmataceae bacterium]
MHWIGLVDHPDHVCCRYRLAAFRPLLEQAGHTLEPRALPRRWWSRVGFFRQLRGENVILQRRLLSSWQRVLLRCAARRLLFDFDDAVFLRDSYAARGLHDGRRLRRFAGLMRAADGVIAGNAFLADHAARWAGAARVCIIPTCVDPTRYPPAEPARTEGVELVWVGSSSTLQGLQAITPLLEAIGRSLPGLRLKLICDRFLELRGLSVLPCPWTESGEAAEIARADIGISWIPDDLWSRGKCGLKVLQYMAAGLPVVCNPIGVHGEMVRHGETGFLAETPAQWIEAIQRLAHDPALRRRMGCAGRQRVEDHYSVTAGAALWVTLLNRLRESLAA